MTTVDGVFAVDLEAEEVLGERPGGVARAAALPLSLPRLIASAASGSTVVAVVDARPPLAMSHDAGLTWRESGRGLPGGRAVAVAADDPDTILYAARNRLFLSRDGGRFWQGLAVELPEIEAVSLD
ncbi:MAG: hypothetical protein ABR521_12815 [Gaiellaceae bacterium]